MRPIVLALAACAATFAIEASAATFRFETIGSLDEMRRFLAREVPLGTGRDALRAMFVEEGNATPFEHPQRDGIEKYLYDVNICSLYVWRWNISANYDDGGALTQVFLNGEPIHSGGEIGLQANIKGKKPGKGQAIYKKWKPRPEASVGEKALAYLLYDTNTGARNVDDEFVIGAGPSRLDPGNFGKMHVYSSVEHWRSIFDEDDPDDVATYEGACPVT